MLPNREGDSEGKDDGLIDAVGSELPNLVGSSVGFIVGDTEIDGSIIL